MNPTRLLLPVFAGLLLVTACGSDDSSSTATTASAQTTAATTDAGSGSGSTAPTPTASSATAATPATTASPATTGEATAKLDINTASIDEMTSAFEAVGVTNAARWAREVDEYRPYSADDTDFAQLRQELGKYNIDPAQLELIISVLTY